MDACVILVHERVNLDACLCDLGAWTRELYVCVRDLWRMVSIKIYQHLARLLSKQHVRCQQKTNPPAYREATCTFLSVTRHYEILVYSILFLNALTLLACRQSVDNLFHTLINGPLGEWIFSNIQSTPDDLWPVLSHVLWSFYMD